jgi:hypothetical protein
MVDRKQIQPKNPAAKADDAAASKSESKATSRKTMGRRIPPRKVARKTMGRRVRD